MFRGAPETVNQRAPRRWTFARFVTTCSSLLIPPQCVLCGAAGQRGPLDLCEGCEADLPWRTPAFERLQDPLDGLFAPFAYRAPLAALIRQWKFHGARHHAQWLGILLARERQRLAPALPDCVVPIPLHPHRRRERGFNQSGELARVLAREVRRPCRPELLRRVRDTRTQSLQPEIERYFNLVGAFAGLPCRGLAIALVDDVFTTGSTMAAAAEVLVNAGARSVEAWAVARAGRTRPSGDQISSETLIET